MTEPVFHVEITAATTDELKALTDEIQPDLGCRPIVRRRGDELVVNAYLSESQIDAARGSRAAGGAAVRVLENATEAGLQRQGEVAEGNRYAVRGAIPRGLGEKE